MNESDTPVAGERRAWIDVTMMVLAVVMFLNVVVAVMGGQRESGFKLIPMWIVLLSLCMVARDMAFLGLLVGLVLCGLAEWICHFGRDSAAIWQKSPPVVVADLVMLLFVNLLSHVKLENVMSRREMEYGSMRKNQNEQIDLVEKIKKKQQESKEAAAPEKKEDKAISQRKAVLEMQKAIYVDVLNLRYRRELPKVLETLFAGWFGYKVGVVFEIAEDSRELKLRAHWGVAEVHANALETISSFKENAVVRFVSDRRDPVLPDDLKKDMTLFEALEAFNKGLFPLSLAVPVVVQDKPAFILLLGEAAPDAKLTYEYKTVVPILAAASMSLVKLSSKDARPSFSTFAPGS
jgi:hypothetical protein